MNATRSGIERPSRRALPGRQLERELFADCLASAIAGSPRLLLFEGEQGSGRSSLLGEIADSPLLPRRRIRVAYITLRPDDPWDAVAHAAHALTSHAVYDRVGGRRRTVRTFRALTGDWIGAIPGWGDLLEAIYRTVEAVRRRRRKATAAEVIEEEIEEILTVARRRPVALLVDNLELADDPAVERLRRLLRHAEAGTRLLLVGAFRTSPPGAPRPPIRNLAERLPAQRLVHRRLGPLAAGDVAEWLAHRLPGAVAPAGFLEWLIAETGGQPGALEASLSALIERGAVREADDGWVIETDPVALEAAEAGGPDLDLSRLGDGPAETVRAASIFGDRFDGDELARVLSLDELLVEDHLAVAARFGLVEVVGTVDRPGGDIATAYRFASSSARAALQRALPRERRFLLHAALDAARAASDSLDSPLAPGESKVLDRSDGP